MKPLKEKILLEGKFKDASGYIYLSSDLYRSLRLINPSPYMAFYNFKDWQIIGSSPEVMVKAVRAFVLKCQ